MGEPISRKIDGFDFNWDLSKGIFQYEGQDALFFGVTTAMRTFFDTIKEISGEDVYSLVLETTGYRQGLEVGTIFETLNGGRISEIPDQLTKMYAVSGWGKITIHDLSFESKTFSVQIKDSWEYRINQSQHKKVASCFIPAYFAGVFSTLLKTNIWYAVQHFQLDGYDHTLVTYGPSSITVNENIHELARKKEAEHILKLESLVKAQTSELRKLVEQLSSPIIPVLKGIIVVPLIGAYDEDRAFHLVDKTLSELPYHRADYLVLDLTGLSPELNEHAIHLIEKISATSRLLGTLTILVGISAELSLAILNSRIQLKELDCFQTLEHGIHYALSQQGRKLL